MRKLARQHRQKLVFIGGGGLSALIDVGIMLGLIKAGVAPMVAASVGFFVSLLVNYAFHAKVTFQSATTTFNFARYLCVVAVNYLLTLAFVAASVALLSAALPGKLAALPAVAVVSYLLSKYWVFR